jgi:hypothetical protein
MKESERDLSFAHLFSLGKKNFKTPTTTATFSSAAKAPFLTTKNGLIVDQTGKEVVMKGINWFGWNTFLDATGEFHFFLFIFLRIKTPPLLSLLHASEKKPLSSFFPRCSPTLQRFQETSPTAPMRWLRTQGGPRPERR